MANDQDESSWPQAFGPKAFRQASEQFTEQQMRLFQQLFASSADGASGAGTGRSRRGSVSDLERLASDAAVFKTRVQSSGRISIPDAEREALDIGDGDLVQVFVLPINRHGDSNE
jgi:hypothetical protein